MFMLLPAGWLLRDWKFSDKRTKKYRRTTKALLASWIILGSLSTYYHWKQSNENQNLQQKASELISGKNDLIKKTSNLSEQLSEYQEEIRAKDERIEELEKQARLLRSVKGSIECRFCADWSQGGHPGSLIPASWNRAQYYTRIFEADASDASSILFYLDSIETIELSGGDLKVKLEVRADTSSGPFGQELGVLKRYKHLLVYVPFIDKGDTRDGKMTLRRVEATFVVNGEKKSHVVHSDDFAIPMPEEGKVVAFQLNKDVLFQDIF